MTLGQMLEGLRKRGYHISTHDVHLAICDGRLPRPVKMRVNLYDYDEAHAERLTEIYRRRKRRGC